MPGKPSDEEQGFQKSPELKRIFNELSELWCKKHRLSLADLAERCGVSQQYLGHIGRYGRIPSRPILTLLAFNLEVSDPQSFFRIAGLQEPWPYERGLGLRQPGPTESGLLQISLNMEGFATAVREIVRAETQPRRLKDLLSGRPLRVGLNIGQFFMFDRKRNFREGFFPELMRAVALALHCELEFTEVLHSDFAERLEGGAIDVFGPVYRTTRRLSEALYTRPFAAVQLAGLARIKKIGALALVPPPAKVFDLRRGDHVVAVHKDSMAHHFAQIELGLPPERLVLCEVPEEAVERILLTNIPRPAHVVLTDAPYALKAHEENEKGTRLVFLDSEPSPQFEDTIAVRSDWAGVVPLLDEALMLLGKSAALQRLFERTIAADRIPGVRLVDGCAPISR